MMMRTRFHRCPGIAALAMFAATAAAQTPPPVRLGSVKLEPYAFLQLDGGGIFDQTGKGGQGSGLNPRRQRLGATADIANQMHLGFIWDFGGTPSNHSRLVEADLAYTGLKPFEFSAGVLKPYFTLEYAQSAADILFLERASIVNIVGGLVAGSGRVTGEAAASGQRWYAMAAMTGGKTGPGAKSDQRALLGRVAGLVIKRNGLALHLGISGAWLFRPPRGSDGRQTLSFSNQPELQLDQASAPLSTGSIGASAARIGGVEAGMGWRRLWLQGEWYGIGVTRPNQHGLFFSGWYAQAAYTVFGRPRRWHSKSASWGSAAPGRGFDPSHGAWGAIEVGARFSTANLNSFDVRGGRQNIWTTGVSWYPVKLLRFILEYEHARISGGQAPHSLDAIAMRGQLKF